MFSENSCRGQHVRKSIIKKNQTNFHQPYCVYHALFLKECDFAPIDSGGDISCAEGLKLARCKFVGIRIGDDVGCDYDACVWDLNIPSVHVLIFAGRS